MSNSTLPQAIKRDFFDKMYYCPLDCVNEESARLVCVEVFLSVFFLLGGIVFLFCMSVLVKWKIDFPNQKKEILQRLAKVSSRNLAMHVKRLCQENEVEYPDLLYFEGEAEDENEYYDESEDDEGFEDLSDDALLARTNRREYYLDDEDEGVDEDGRRVLRPWFSTDEYGRWVPRPMYRLRGFENVSSNGTGKSGEEDSGTRNNNGRGG